MRTAAIDLGNTRAKTGIFDGDVLAERRQWKEPGEPMLGYLANQKVSAIIFSNTGQPLRAAFLRQLNRIAPSLRLSEQVALPFENTYRTPETLGKDRLAGVAGAQQLYPGQHSLVVDAGTCITYDLLQAGRTYRGGNIAPGLEMRLQAMYDYTSRLPKVDKGPIDQPWGRSTQEALRNGAVLGIALEIDGMARLASRSLGPINVVLTGGDAEFIENLTETKIFANPNLVLQGLNAILLHNAANLA